MDTNNGLDDACDGPRLILMVGNIGGGGGTSSSTTFHILIRQQTESTGDLRRSSYSINSFEQLQTAQEFMRELLNCLLLLTTYLLTVGIWFSAPGGARSPIFNLKFPHTFPAHSECVCVCVCGCVRVLTSYRHSSL